MSKLCFISIIENTLESFVIPAAYLFKQRGHDVSLLCTMSERFFKKYGNDKRHGYPSGVQCTKWLCRGNLQ